MAKLFQNPDGANFQARAVLAFLQDREGIEESWNPTRGCYVAEPEVDRWHNCREQGYVISLRTAGKQLNIAFFEHRNGDDICMVEWQQVTGNPPTIETMNTKGKIYKDKYDVSKRFGYGDIPGAAAWIIERLAAFWTANQSKKKAA